MRFKLRNNNPVSILVFTLTLPSTHPHTHTHTHTQAGPVIIYQRQQELICKAANGESEIRNRDEISGKTRDSHLNPRLHFPALTEALTFSIHESFH